MAEFISVEDVWVGEGDGVVNFRVRLDRPATQAISVDWATSTAGGNANSLDFTAGSGTLSFGVGESEKTITVALRENTTVEALETFQVLLGNPIGAAIAKARGTAVIVDNDTVAATPRISVSDAIVDEATGFVTFVVRLDSASLNPISVDFATQNGSARSGSDFVATSDTLHFLPGEMVKTVTVEILNDGAREQDETFFLNLSSPANATLGQAQGRATIIDNDAATADSPLLHIEDVVVGESDGVARLVIRLDRPSDLPVSVTWGTNGPGATANSLDFNAATGVLTFAPGEVVKTVLVSLDNNTTIEGPEAFFPILSNPVNANLGRARATALILDDDATSASPRISVADVTVDEAARAVDVVVRLDAAATGPVTVTYGTVNGTATAGADYESASGTLTFLRGEMARTVRINLVDDARAEDVESFGFRLSGAVGGEIAAPTATITVIDNDGPRAASPTVSVADSWATERTGLITFGVALSAPSAQAVTVDWSATSAGGTANSLDFNAASGRLTFAPGEMFRTIDITLDNNTTLEPIETFFLNLSNPVGALLGKASGRGTILDDDAAAVATPTFGVVPGFSTSVGEGERWVDVPVMLSAPSPSVQRVAYETRSGSATTGVDFLASSGTLAFLPGEMTKTVRVFLKDDATFEALETLRIVFTGLGPASPSSLPQTVTLSIIDNEPPITGGPGADQLRGTDGFDRMFGLGGNDHLRGLGGDDELFGGAGNDLLDGGLGRDRMDGGAGDDRYVVENRGDRVIEAARGGTDTVESSIDYKLPKNVENLTLTGGKKLDGVGNSLDNVLRGNNKANTLEGGKGDDSLYGGNGKDTLDGGKGADRLYGGNGKDTLDGGNGADRLEGGNGKDVLDGGKGDDVLFGGGGRDILIGGLGVDEMTGGAGADRFVFLEEKDSRPGRKSDVILDFTRKDFIDLSALDANLNRSGNQSFDYIGKAGFSGDAGELRFSKGVLQADTDGDGRADFAVLLDGVTKLSVSDILL